MFKISIPVTKSYISLDSNTLVIEGIASDSTIDRDMERFSENAVKGMSESVNGGDIPIKIEHGDNIFSEVGVWKEASINEDGKMYVKGEIDLDLSMGKDIQVLLNKGFKIALSVGGMVKDAVNEFNVDLGKSIKTYTDIILKEISIVKNPANYNATLSIAKSFNFEDKVETIEAINLSKSLSYTIKASESFIKSINEIEELLKNSITSSDTSIFLKACGNKKKSEVVKDCEDGMCEDYCEPDEGYEMSELTYLDYKIIGMIYRIYTITGADEIKEPDGLDWESQMKLPDYSFLPLQCDSRLIPYMDMNLKLRKDWIIYGMYRLAKGEYGWINASDRSYAMEFLYAAYKQILVNSSKSFEEKSDIRPIRNDEIELMQKCVEYKLEKNTRPQYEGNDLSDVEINKLAKAYSVLTDRSILKNNSEKTMTKEELLAMIAKCNTELQAMDVVKNENIVTEEVTTTAGEVIATEEVIKTDVVTEVLVEEVTDTNVAAEDTTEIVEEVNADATKNNTSIDEAALLKSITSVIETAVKAESNKTTESIIALEKSFNEKLEAIKSANEESISKSVNNTTEIEKSNSEAIEKLATIVSGISDTVKSYSEAKGDRKSFAVAIQKGYMDKELGKSTEELILAEMENSKIGYAKARATVLGSQS